MDEKSTHQSVKKAINVILVLWAVIFIPVMIMIILMLSGHGEFQSHNEFSWKILYYNLLLTPFVIIISSIWSYILLKQDKLTKSLFVALIPFISILIELVLVDIILWFV